MLIDNNNDKLSFFTLSNKEGEVITNLKYLYHISGAHNSVVNILRFSPNGKYLASAGDDQTIVVWTLKKRPVEFGVSEEKIIWSIHKLLRGHSGDIYDLSWSSDSNYLISGSVDNNAIVWNVEKAKGIIMLKDHQHFVQGVSWDPLNEYLLTQSADKSMNAYSVVKSANEKLEIRFKFYKKIKSYIYETISSNSRITNEKPDNPKESLTNTNTNANIITIMNNKNQMEIDSEPLISNNNLDHQDQNKITINKITVNYFASENNHPGFFRRLSWSPDGSFCLAVGGVNYNYEDKKYESVVWGFTRKELSVPTFFLPTLSPAICVRFCPVIFQKDKDNINKNTNTSEPNSQVEMIKLPYKLVFAIGTQDSIIIYDTQSINPKFVVTNIHLMQITDLTWNSTEFLCASSSDGYISFLHFNDNEFGVEEKEENLNEPFKSLFLQYKSVSLNKIIEETELNTNFNNIKIIKKKAENNNNNNLDNNDNKQQVKPNLESLNREEKLDKNMDIEKDFLLNNIDSSKNNEKDGFQGVNDLNDSFLNTKDRVDPSKNGNDNEIKEVKEVKKMKRINPILINY